jgi:hypothetical protein
LRDLARNGGDLQTTVGLDETRFVNLWLEYLRTGYGI